MNYFQKRFLGKPPGNGSVHRNYLVLTFTSCLIQFAFLSLSALAQETNTNSSATQESLQADEQVKTLQKRMSALGLLAQAGSLEQSGDLGSALEKRIQALEIFEEINPEHSSEDRFED